MATKQILVPDIGDFENVPIIDVYIKVGDVIAVEDSVVALESEKAVIDIPSPPFAGTITKVLVKEGDAVSKDSPVAEIEVESEGVKEEEKQSTEEKIEKKEQPEEKVQEEKSEKAPENLSLNKQHRKFNRKTNQSLSMNRLQVLSTMQPLPYVNMRGNSESIFQW